MLASGDSKSTEETLKVALATLNAMKATYDAPHKQQATCAIESALSSAATPIKNPSFYNPAMLE